MYTLDQEESQVTIHIREDVTTEILWEHPWHPDHGMYQRETFRDLLERGKMALYYDTVPVEAVFKPDAALELYFELDTIPSARNGFRFRRVCRRGEEAGQYTVQLQITGAIEQQEE